MRLEIAAAILASAFPNVSSVSAQLRHTQQQQQQQQQQQHEATTFQLQIRQRALQRLRQRRIGDTSPWSASSASSASSMYGQGITVPVNRVANESGGRLSRGLKNTHGELPPVVPQECDPTRQPQYQHGRDQQEVDNENMLAEFEAADVGILSCGVGEYCRASDVSTLGGLCASLDGTTANQRRRAVKRKGVLRGNRAVDPMGDVSSQSLLDRVTTACETTDYCDCSGFDFEDFHGTIECTTLNNYCSTLNNYCNKDITLCLSATATLSIAGPSDYTYTDCIHYTEPYHQKVCITYDTAAPNACSVEFNNEMCQSCVSQFRVHEDAYEQNGSKYTYIYNQRCFDFDCTNSEGAGHKGSSCEREVATIGHNVVFGDDCDRCSICGLGYQMTNGAAIQYFPVIGEYRCDGLELAANIGFLNQEVCPEIQEAAFAPCGCEPIFFDSKASTGITMQPSMVPSLPESASASPEKEPSHTGPSVAPSASPSQTKPSIAPSLAPSETQPSVPPSAAPLAIPVVAPSAAPSAAPISAPSAAPSATPVAAPSAAPSATPVAAPSAAPVSAPPSAAPVSPPSTVPSSVPSVPPFPAIDEADGVPCYICGDKDATFTYPDASIILPDSVSTCSKFALEALASIISEDYCTEQIQPRAEFFCGCVLPVATRAQTSLHVSSSSPSPAVVTRPTAVPTSISSPPPSLSQPSLSQTNIDPEVEILSPEDVFICNTCGANGTVANATDLVTLSNGASSCGALYHAGRAGAFTEVYCREIVIPLVEEHCGCIVASPSEPSGANETSSNGRRKWEHFEIDADEEGIFEGSIQPNAEPSTGKPTMRMPSSEPSLGPSLEPPPVARPLINEVSSSQAGAGEVHDDPPDEDDVGNPDVDSGATDREKSVDSESSEAPAMIGSNLAVGIPTVIGLLLFACDCSL